MIVFVFALLVFLSRFICFSAILLPDMTTSPFLIELIEWPSSTQVCITEPTDSINFKNGKYTDRRVNLTLLYGSVPDDSDDSNNSHSAVVVCTLLPIPILARGTIIVGKWHNMQVQVTSDYHNHTMTMTMISNPREMRGTNMGKWQCMQMNSNVLLRLRLRL
jgi:hypothetical protein